jgi:hypothetical protein
MNEAIQKKKEMNEKQNTSVLFMKVNNMFTEIDK